MPAGIDVGVALVIVGLALGFVVWGFLKLLSRAADRSDPAQAGTQSPQDESADAVIVLEQGGRVGFLSGPARAWFDVPGGEPPDLDELLRRVRPPDEFLELVAAPGQRRLNINGRPAEVTSYRVPGVQRQMLLSLQSLDLAPAVGSVATSGLHVPGIVAEFGAAISASLDLDSVVRSVLDHIQRLVPAKFVELGLADMESSGLVFYRLLDANGSLPKLVRNARGPFGELAAKVQESGEPFFLENLAAAAAELQASAAPGLSSYLGIPLRVGDQPVGVLEVAQATGSALSSPEYELLRLLAPQIAAALRNAILFEEQRKRAAEYLSLAGIAEAFSVLREPEDLFSRLVDAVAPLFNAQIVGFLIFDETRRVLEGQVPFRGLPPHIVGIYRTKIEAGGAAEALITRQQPLVSANAADDDNWRTLGLTDFAVAASLRDTVLMPLVESGTVKGFLQLSHREGGPAVSESEMRMLQVVASQVAAIIANSLLVRESRDRLAKSQGLSRLTELAAAASSADELLSLGLQELSRQFQVGLAIAFLLDQTRGELRPHPGSAVMPSGPALESTSVLVDEPAYRQTVTGSRRSLIVGRASLDAQLQPFYRMLCEPRNIESLLAVPLIARGRALGEVVLGSRSPDFFIERDQQLLATAAASLASTMDRLAIESQTDASLRRQVDQLSSVARVGRELGSVSSVADLLKVVHDETITAAGAECGSITLVDGDGSITAPVGMQSEGCVHRTEFSALERRAIENGEPISIADFAQRRDLPGPHEGVRSALLVPILQAGRTLGLIQVHSPQPGAFDASIQETVSTLATQAGVALVNVHRGEEDRRQAELLQRRTATLQKFTQASSALSPDLPLAQALTFVAEGIRESTPFRVVLVSLYESESGMLQRLAGAGIEPETLAELQARKQPLSTLQQLTQPQFRISRSYFIPADETPVLPADIHYVYARQYSETEAAQNAWDPDDFLLLPLEDAGGSPLGLISLDDPSNGLRPDRATIETAELFAVQAAQIISNWRLRTELDGRIESLSSGLSRQQQLLSVTQNDLPVLLHKDLEQTMALHAVERRAQRVRAGLAITESISRQLDASSALLALGRETLTQFGMSIAMVAENTPEGPRLLHVLGNVPTTMNVEALFGQRNPLRSSLQTGASILVPNIEDNEEWRETPLLSQLRAKGIISLPVLMDNRPVASMMAVSTDPLPVLTDEDRQVYLQISRQASVVLQNISLLNETRRRLHEVNILLEFSRQLTGLDPGQIMEALLESARRALSGAHAGAVLLWNENTGMLEPRAASGYADDDSILQISYVRGAALPGEVFQSGAPRRIDEVDFARDYALQPAELGLYRRGTGGRLPVSSLLLPIMIEDKGIGLVVLDNFNTPGAFRPEDEALVLALSQQAALSLENVRLVRALTERAGQLQGLNEVSTVLASSLRTDQLVATLLDQMGRLLPYDTAALWLRDGDRLIVAADRGFGDQEKRLGLSIDVNESALFQEIMTKQQPLFVADVREDARFPSDASQRLSWLGVPMLSKGALTGLIAVEKSQASFYTHEQIQLAATLASQAAVALENASLYESSVQHATELNERSERLALLNRFSASLGGLLDVTQVLSSTAEELRRLFGADRVSAISVQASGPTWVASVPPMRQRLPQPLANVPLFAQLGESLGVFMTEHVPDHPELEQIRQLIGKNTVALLAIPLSLGRQLLGVLLVSDPASGHFAAAEVEIARTVANQASIALQGARLYQSTVRSAEQLTVLNQASAEIGTSLDPEAIYASIHQAVKRLMAVDSFVITVLDDETQEIEAVYFTDGERLLGPRRVFLGRGLGSSVISSGEPVLLRDAQDIVAFDGAALTSAPALVSAVAVPMTIGNRVVGMLSARSRQADTYTEEDLRLLATLANQAVVTIQNGRLFEETERLARELEQRVVERTSELRHEQQNTETLLRILTEVSSSLDLDRALNRTLTLLNDAVRAEQGTIMLLDSEDNMLHYRAGFGYASDKAGQRRPGLKLRVGEGLAGWVVQHREPALVADVRKDSRWLQSPGISRDHRSAVVVPLMAADEVFGALMVFSRTEAYFTAENLTLVNAIANQVAAAINNARLYELVREQAERLGLMLRKEQEEASRSQAILESVADGVLVTSADNRISFANTSVQHILGTDVTALVGQPLERFSGLFGEPGQAWVSAILRWSEAPAAEATGDTYAERIDLPNNRIALIHLAPVILEHDFLGTVSILRDITHEVEVDRLKSEFVATVSHELRTPMTAIKGYVEMLLMGAVGAVNENQSHFLQIVASNIDRLNALVGDLLDVSRIESGKVAISPEPLDLASLADEVIGEIRQKSEQDKRPVSITRAGSKTVPAVMGDPERMRQILRILVDNAYHYTPEGGTVEVLLRALPRRAGVQIDVTDSGIGISPGDQERVFERFFRGDNPMVLATPGTGLGLSIARQLVGMHGGQITVQSEGVEGRGSTFTVTLPVGTAPSDAGSATAGAVRKKTVRRPASTNKGSKQDGNG